MTSPDPNAKTKSEFTVAGEITNLLSGLDKAQQERILRWVGESLGLAAGHHTLKHSEPHPDRAGVPRPDGTPTVPSLAAEAGRAKDIRSFAEEKRPKSDVQFVAVVAYYHRFLAPERKEAIGSEDLQQGSRLAGRPVHKTPSVTLNNAVAQGYMDRAERGQYKLNAVGENLVSMTLPDAGGGTAVPRRARRKGAAAGKTASRKARES